MGIYEIRGVSMVSVDSSSNLEENFGGWISSPSDVPGSGEVSSAESKDVEDERLDLTTRRSSRLAYFPEDYGHDRAGDRIYDII